MAFINATISHPIIEMDIEVLEPKKDEPDYKYGMKINVGADFEVSLDDLREVIKWMTEVADDIEKNFEKSGKPKLKGT